MGIRVGIDFGTSNSGVAVYRDGKVQLLPIDGRNLVPEVVKTILYITRDHKTFIGQEAVELYYKHNINRLRRFMKKWVGEIDYHGGELNYVRDVYVYVDELQPGRLMQFIKTALRSERYTGTQVFDRYYTTSEIIAIYLKELKQRAEKVLGEEITGVTLGRPVKFHSTPGLDQKSQDTLERSALEAGFEQVNFELEPIAAALYYELSLHQPQNVLIFDFGGGTLDLTVMRLGDRQQRTVYASGGIGIAGSDFDRAIITGRLLGHFGRGFVEQEPEIQALIATIPDWSSLPELSTPRAKAELDRAIQAGKAPVKLKALEALIFNDLAFSFYNRVEAAKIELSSQGVTVIGMHEKYLDLWEMYTRRQFESDILEFREQIEQVLLETLHASGLEVRQIDAVVKTGGSSNIPVFSSMLEGIFGAGKVRSSDVFNSVTAGLAIRAAQG